MVAIPLRAQTRRIYVDESGAIWQLQSANTVVNVGTIPLPPINTALPVVSGSLSHGSTLSCTTGTWNPTGTYTYQWMRANSQINGATSATYVTGTSDVNRMMTCVVTATNGGGAPSAISNAVGPIT